MSTLAYTFLINKREEASRRTSSDTSPPGVGKYIEIVAALVPAEVLSLHAIIISVATEINQDAAGNSITTIKDPTSLAWAFFGLIILSIILYVVPRLKKWKKLDFFRALIPPAAFVCWTMLQRVTAFDAICPEMGETPRIVIPLIGAVLLGLLANYLAPKADMKPLDKS